MNVPGHRHRPLHGDGAFTLAEMVVAVGLMTILVTFLFAILTSAQDTVTETRRARDIHENARVAVETIKDELLTSAPPRHDVGLYEAGYMFVIRNNADGEGNDELWFTAASGVDSNGHPIKKNFRYFVACEEDTGLKVLRRQEFQNLFADYYSPPTPGDEDTANICEYIEQFDVQYLTFKVNLDNAVVPDKYIPDLLDEKRYNVNFRDEAVWVGLGMPDNQTSPPALRITMVVRDRRGRQTSFIQKICRVPFSVYEPLVEEPPPSEEEEEEEEEEPEE